MNIAIIYGSTTGNTAAAANAIGKAFDDLGDVSVTPVSDGFGSAADANLVILGTSTWGIGEIQDDWQGKEDFGGLGLAGKKVAVFGTGDQNGFGDTFVDGIGLLAEAAEKAGGTLVGAWPIEGYDFGGSLAVRGDAFVGLALDDDNQPDLTDSRIAAWTAQIRQEL